jgi:hypothetical protein
MQARIARQLGNWQDGLRPVAVEFALCRAGDLKIHCVGIPARRAPPAFVEMPRSTKDARALAAKLVTDAIALIEGER